MKYIRTKDGIFEVTDSYKVDAGFIKYEVKNALCVADFEIVKQADTIEELCDEFVYVASKEDRPILIYKPSVFHKITDELFGAIWTGKGLIYVAKMNNEGELELL